jgi:cytochrome c556
MNRTKITVGLFVTAIALSPSASPAHEGATGVVKERMDAMTQAGKAMKDAGERIRSNRDPAAVKDDALAVAAVASRIAAQFPAGSDTHPSDARPEIWTHWVDFAARAQALERESRNLAAAADTSNLGATAGQFQAVGRVCTGCHDAYRVKRE